MSSRADQAFQAIEAGEAIGLVPIIVLAEIMHAAERKRIPINFTETVGRLSHDLNFRIVPFDFPVLLEAASITQLAELHDRIIVATARSYKASLITADRAIQRSGAVAYVW